jgi:putative AdoMet-dependent methyltransferase
MDIDFYWDYANAVRESQGPAWRYDERKACGVNYHSSLLARLYDVRHQAFRDYEREAEQIVAALGLDGSATVIDMGCGTGAFAVHAGRHYRKVHAVDVSKAMLRQARRKARKAGIANVEFHQGGFLTYEHQAGPADAAVSVAVLHHLPDFWKLVGLHRLASMLGPDGRLYLFDVVFSFDVAQHEPCFERFIDGMSQRMGFDGRTEAETHLREEYSTCDWIMKSLLERAGFRIDEANYMNNFFAAYLCTKKTKLESGL